MDTQKLVSPICVSPTTAENVKAVAPPVDVGMSDMNSLSDMFTSTGGATALPYTACVRTNIFESGSVTHRAVQSIAESIC